MAPRLLLPFALAAFGLFACHKAEVTSYRIPKETAPAHPAMAAPAPAAVAPTDATHAGLSASGPMMAGMPASGVAAPSAPAVTLTWTAPAHWQAKPASQMRRGSFNVPGEGGAAGDLSIFAFPGAAGGLLENVNRWRGQVGLAPIDANRLADEALQTKSDSGLDFTVVDMVGAQGDRILGAILTLGSDSWFFKLRGPDALVTKEKPAFLAFLKTVKAP
jgi:hypothetical protein